MRLMQEMDLTIEDVDALTGQAVGWPRSATFRTIDLVGLDILGHVVRNMKEEGSTLPDFYQKMLERKWLGDKTKGGFYKKGKDDERFALDWKTLEYHPREKPKFPALDMAKNVEDTGARVRMLLGMEGAPQKGDRAGAFLWSALSDLWTYAANRVPEISDSIVEIDRAMKLGFNWELGPFELWDAAGVEATVARMKKEGRAGIGKCGEAARLRARNPGTSDEATAASGRAYFDLGTKAYKPVDVPLGVWSVAVAKKSNGVVKKNAGASLVDLGDGVGCIEFHSKMNSLGARHHFADHADAEARRAWGQFRRFRDHQRRSEFFRGREPDVAAHVRAGRRVGRRGHGHPAVPGDDAGHQVLTEAGSDRPIWPGTWRRHAKSRCTVRLGNRMPNSTWDWWKSASACCPAAADAKKCCCAPLIAQNQSGRADAESPSN